VLVVVWVAVLVVVIIVALPVLVIVAVEAVMSPDSPILQCI